MMRSLYIPLIIFWNAATGQPQADNLAAERAIITTVPRRIEGIS
jgi:hypothetical protein